MKKTFINNTLKLLGSNIFSQLLVVACLPIVTFLYTPEQFGYFGVIISIASALTILALLKSDIYLMSLEVANERYYSATTLIFRMQFIQSAAIFIIFILFSEYAMGGNIGNITFNFLEYGVLFSLVLFSALYQLFSSFYVNQSYLNVVATTSVLKAFVLVFTQILLGFAHIALGLWFAELLSRVSQVYACFKTGTFGKATESRWNEKMEIKKYFSSIRPFATYSMPANLLSTLTQYIPVLYAATMVGIKVAGIYFMAHRLVNIPLSMLCQSISKAFVAEFLSLDRVKQKQALFNKTTAYLFFGGVILVTFVYFLLPLIERYEPEAWQGTISAVQIMIFIFIPMLTVSSVSQIFNLIGAQRTLLISEFIKLSLVVFAVSYAKYVDITGLNSFVVLLVASLSVGYIVQFILLTLKFRYSKVYGL